MSSFVARGVHFMKHQVSLTLDQRVAIASFAQWCDDNGLIGNEADYWRRQWKRTAVDGPPPVPTWSEYKVWVYQKDRMPHPELALRAYAHLYTHWAHLVTPPIPEDAV